jgi:hypothetical protein
MVQDRAPGGIFADVELIGRESAAQCADLVQRQAHHNVDVIRESGFAEANAGW